MTRVRECEECGASPPLVCCELRSKIGPQQAGRPPEKHRGTGAPMITDEDGDKVEILGWAATEARRLRDTIDVVLDHIHGGTMTLREGDIVILDDAFRRAKKLAHALGEAE